LSELKLGNQDNENNVFSKPYRPIWILDFGLVKILHEEIVTIFIFKNNEK